MLGINYLFNRDLSWIAFNDRVLNEASDPSVPLLERLRFISIVSSNLDEFFMVRVAENARIARRFPGRRLPDGLTASQAIVQIREAVLMQKSRQASVLAEILTLLRKKGIDIKTDFDKHEQAIDDEARSKMGKFSIFIKKIGERMPHLESDRIYVFVRFPEEYAVIKIKREQRLLRLSSAPDSAIFILGERWICSHIRDYFLGREVIECFPFKIIREHDLRYNVGDGDSLEYYVEKSSARKIRSRVIRLEVDASNYSEGAMYLASSLRIDSASLYRFNMPLDLRSFFAICSIKGFEQLKYPPIKPVMPSILQRPGKIMSLIERRDIMLHHPYDSFDIVVNFLKEAARDPEVTEIFHVVYRTDRDSPIMNLLKEAVLKGKKVTVYVEIKARFDELNNLRWIKDLRLAGVNVIPPFSRYKVHSKVTQVVKGYGSASHFYTHLGTGNYHSGTARQYTDLGILTCDEEIGREVREYFHALSSKKQFPYFKNLLVAPVNLRLGILKLIREEIKLHKETGDGLIMAKMNSLADPDIIKELYKASTAGVKVRLLVRGICCLKPGIKGLSENIKVTSIVDRFLEHSRIYYFRAGGAEKIYLASADWMPRNFYNRFEISFPVKDALLKKYIKDVILKNSFSDNTKASTLMPDGKYVKIKPEKGESRIRSQFLFVSMSEALYKGTVLEKRLIDCE